MKSTLRSLTLAFLALGVVGTVTITGCNKQKQMDDLSQTVQQSANQANSVTPKPSATPTNSTARKQAGSAEEYQEMIRGVAETMDQSEDYMLEVSLDEEGNYTVTPHTGRLAPP